MTADPSNTILVHLHCPCCALASLTCQVEYHACLVVVQWLLHTCSCVLDEADWQALTDAAGDAAARSAS